MTRCAAEQHDPEGFDPPIRCTLPAGHEGFHEVDVEPCVVGSCQWLLECGDGCTARIIRDKRAAARRK